MRKSFRQAQLTMPARFAFYCAFIIGFLLSASMPVWSLSPSAAESIIEAYRSAHNSSDADQAMALVHLQGVPNDIQMALRQQFITNFAYQIDRIELNDLDPAQPLRFTRDRQQFQPNLTVTKELIIYYTNSNTQGLIVSQSAYLVGEKNGRFMISTAAPIPSP